ncbi:VOC family protein [Jiella sonneratiae]|uniref:VOC family protein n=1 Tax=Jiella sonneratiae TaxID=2816856 RepID=A0ABS3J8U0_9HYPH|nr:VOC family protein [Jiella sonneratiae]MBO0906090.1 VOC family protein [Jiella sonneratiae]
MTRVTRISHATFTTPDLDRLTDYYVEVLGLSLAARDKDRAFLATVTGQQALVLEKGEVPFCTKIAFQIAPGRELGEVAKGLAERHGIDAERRSDAMPGVAEILSFADPKGTTIELFSDAEPVAFDRTPKGFVPLKLGHIAFKATELQPLVRFYEEVLGFRVSDWREDFFVWMRCGPDHHTANFVRGDKPKMHHVAFELKDQAEIIRACDFLGKNGFPLIYGPGRHVIGDNIFTYHRNPDGQIVELYTELARIDSEELGYFVPRPWREDHPYEPKTWGPGTVGNLWGPSAPPDFRDG